MEYYAIALSPVMALVVIGIIIPAIAIHLHEKRQRRHTCGPADK